MIVFILILIISLALAVIASVKFFLRDPERAVTQIRAVLLSPADGTVVSVRRYTAGEAPTISKGGKSFKVEELAGTDLLGVEGTVVSIHISPLDVHTIRSPTDGKIVHINKIVGGLKLMRDPSFEVENERVSIVLETFAGRVGVIIVGAPIASSVNTLAGLGDGVNAGQRIARIRLGSLASLVIPDESNLSVIVRCGERVKAGLTIIARKTGSYASVEECYGTIRIKALERLYLVLLLGFVLVKRPYSYIVHAVKEKTRATGGRYH